MVDGFTTSILGVSNLVESEDNKIEDSGTQQNEGRTGEEIDVLDLDLTDDELLELRDDWEGLYAPYEGQIKSIFARNLNSYLGRDKDGRVLDADMPGPANLQFEAEETFIPAALARNPDPLVYCDNTPEGQAIADATQTMLKFHADQLLLKSKLKVMVRQWSIYLLGVLKYGWETDDVCVENRKIQDFIFDPNGYVDVYGDFSSYLGERIHVTAERLAELFPKHKEYIEQQVESKMGTEVTYTEWWTDDFCFSTFKKVILDKHKNEFFNYEKKQSEEDIANGMEPQKPKNHFAKPKKPYTFLSVFSLQERPHDLTSLLEQNIQNQAKITKRVAQIDLNVSKSNNSEIYSENNFNQETAKQAANAMADPAKGKVLVPAGGPIGEAIVRLQAPSFPDAAFKDLEMSENHLRSSWGVQGITSQPPKPDETARGMILNQGRDTSRIGGGISDILEQSVARSVFNWLVQLYYVFYDEKHFAAVMGVGKAVQYEQLSNQSFDRQLVVSVSPNSMMPKDETSIANEAQTLAKAGFIGPKTLLERLNFPNAEDAAADGILWKIDPTIYLEMNFPEQFAQVQQILAQRQQQQAQAQQQEAMNNQAVAEQGLQQKEAGHQQKLRQNEETHQQKMTQSRDIASAKMAQLPK